MREPLILAVLLATACTSQGGGPYPSLQPRVAEAIDPRIQPVRPMNDRPVSRELAAQLAALVGEARAGQGAFAPAADNAERLAAAAGPPMSEGWIAAQEALSAAIAARKPTAVALADIDALGANALQRNGGIAPNDLKAIDSAAQEVAAIARGQTDRIAAMQRRLGS
jgi:hypothetical protein